MWIEDAIKKSNQEKLNYCRRKLLKNDFFLGITFKQLQRICENSKLVNVGAGDILLNEGETPKFMFCLVEGALIM